MELMASMVFLTCSITCCKRVSVMLFMEFFNAFTMRYASLLGGYYPTERRFARKLSEVSCTSGATEASITRALSLLAWAYVASLTTILHRSLPIDGFKSISG